MAAFTNVNGKVMPSGPGGWVPNPANVVIITTAPPSTAATDVSIGTIAILPGTGAWIATNNTGLNGTVTWSDITPDAITGNLVITAGNLVIATAGNGITIAEGANARMGQATLVLGTVTVANTSITANTRIFLSRASNNASTALGNLQPGTVTVGTSFVIEAGTAATPDTPVAGDLSTVNWLLIEAT